MKIGKNVPLADDGLGPTLVRLWEVVGEVDKASLVKRSRKPLPVDPLTGQVIGDQTKRVEVRRKV